MHPARRIIWSALAVLALALPGQALAGNDLDLYKVEKQVELTSDDQVAELGCKYGDHVVDGMWRIDHADHDEDEDQSTALARAVNVLEARAINGSTYRFHFVKWAIGRVQLKLFATCLGAATASGEGHRHSVTVSSFHTMHWQKWDNQAFTFDGDLDVGNAVTEYACPRGWWAVTPGFVFTSPASDEIEPGFGRIYQSEYSDYRMRSWTWAFQFGPSGGEVDVSLRCLRQRVDAGVPGDAAQPPAGDRHRLIAKYQQFSPSFRRGRVSVGQTSCSSHYKALVSGFAIDPAYVGADLDDPATRLWYLGMDPRIKTRAFTAQNSSGAKLPMDTRTLCINDRTT